jgi:hypothetical protein
MLLPEPIIANWLMPALTYGVVHSIQILDGVQDDQRKRAGGAGLVFEDVVPVGHHGRVKVPKYG